MSALDKYRDHGLLLLRVGLGVMFVMHGWPKLAGGAATWEKLGAATAHLGIDFWPTAFGFAASISEFGGGILLALGLLFRPACVALAGTMAVATMSHLAKGDGVMGASHAIEVGTVFLGLLFIGPGAYSIDARRGG